MKKVFVFIMAALLCATMAACDTDAPTTTGAGTAAANSTTAPKTEFSIPGTLSAQNFDLTVVSAELSDSVTLNAGMDIDYTADEGKQYLTLCIDATNTSDETRNLGTLSAYVDNVAVLPDNFLGKLGDRLIFVGGIDAGKTIQTYIMFQVPVDWEKFEFSYIDSLTGSQSASVTINRADVSAES